jgi:hypothetical protein
LIKSRQLCESLSSFCFKPAVDSLFPATCQLTLFHAVSTQGITQLILLSLRLRWPIPPHNSKCQWLAGWLAGPLTAGAHAPCTWTRNDRVPLSHTFLAEHTDLTIGRKRGGQGSRPPSSSHPIYCCSTVMRSPRNLDPGLPCYSLALGDVISTQTLRGRSSSSTLCDI